jgi:hypothetical protein
MYRTRTLVVAVTALLGAALLPMGMARARPAASPPSLSDGNWIGSLAWSGNQTGSPGNAGLTVDSAVFNGGGNILLTAQGTQIEDGSYTMVVSGTVVGHDDTGAHYDGDRAMHYSGSVGGTTAAPCLQGQYDITGSITVGTPAGPMEVSLGPGELVLPVACADQILRIDAATCDEASGAFALSFGDVNAANGIQLTQSATFVLFRVGNRFTQAEAAANAQQLEDWVQRAAAAPAGDVNTLRDVMAEVERAYGNAPRNAACRRTSNSPGRTALAETLRTMTLAYLTRFADAGRDELAVLIHANYVVNGNTWNDPDPYARRVRNELYSALDDLVGRLETAGDAAGLERVETLARQNGWNRVATDARDAWARVNQG